MRKIETMQVVDAPLAEVWDFFSNPYNLEKLTPKGVRFTFLENPVDKIYLGQLLRYKISPLFGVSVNWTSRIDVVEEHRRFTDVQVKGPFKVWRHEHTFAETPNGTAIKDVLQYELPLGFIGNMLHPLVVKPKLEEIFEFRKKKIREFFLKNE